MSKSLMKLKKKLTATQPYFEAMELHLGWQNLGRHRTKEKRHLQP